MNFLRPSYLYFIKKAMKGENMKEYKVEGNLNKKNKKDLEKIRSNKRPVNVKISRRTKSPTTMQIALKEAGLL